MKKLLYLFSLLFIQVFYAQSDCITAIPVCGDANISYNPATSGNIQEDTDDSCLALEHYSVWYSFTISDSGTLGFTITPNTVPGVTHYDYDFAVYGPNFDCTTGDFGNPISCNFSGTSGPTGLSPVHTSSQWNPLLNVQAGETYYLLIDNYIPSNPYGFDLTWEGSASLTSPFNSSLQPNPFIEPGINQDGQIIICADPQLFDFSTLSAGILNGNPNFAINYFDNSNDAITGTNPITTPINVNTTTTYHYAINYNDPNPNNAANNCKEFGTIDFVQGNITPNNPTIFACNDKNLGTATFDLTTAVLFAGTGNTTQYFQTLADAQAGTNPITNPTSYQSTETVVYGLVTTPQNCSAIGEITLEFFDQLPLTPTTIYSCNNNDIGTGSFDLTLANINADPAWTIRYYPTSADVMAETNEISNTTAYQANGGVVYALVTDNVNSCSSIVIITLEFLQNFAVTPDSLESCFEQDNPTFAFFDLTQADVTAITGPTFLYYPTLNDALNDTNEINDPTHYLSPNGFAYIKVTSINNCWMVAEVKLTVLQPNYSEVLVAKTICIEDRTTLDAGPGYTSYLWSTGATTQTISNVGVGAYWVDLTSDDGCVTHQEVNVYASELPVITSVDITNNTITINVSGGTAPYQYSLDNINWQDSNVFTGLERGEVSIFIRDSYECEATETVVTVPNLVNAITPNDDNINDKIDYSALSYKKDLVVSIFDRYGNKVGEANKTNGYTWNGRKDGKRVSTGTYWYTVTWTEPASGRPIKFNGWVLVKNRD